MAERSSETEVTGIPGDIACLEELMRDLPGESGTANGLMREHLEQARFYLIGSMPQEYRFTLGLAEQFLPEIEGQELRTRIASFLHSQLPA